MKVVIAPDNFGGTLSARQAAMAIATGWGRHRADDEVVLLPLSDGGEGLLDVLAASGGRVREVEVAGPQGHPVDAPLLLRADGSAVIESAAACGLHLLPPERRTPLLATTYGVGQLLDAAREAGVRRILVGLGGSASIDGGAGALIALGYRLRMADGSGLKVGAGDLHRIARVEPGWSADWSELEVELVADVTAPLLHAAEQFGPQKGATPAQIPQLTSALAVWAAVVERDLGAPVDLKDTPGSGAAGGLGFGLAAALGATFVAGSATIADLVGLDEALAAADLVITGEGRLDHTTSAGKVVDHVTRLARRRRIRAAAVVGQHAGGGELLDDVEASAPDGQVVDAAAEVAAAAHRLAARFERDTADR